MELLLGNYFVLTFILIFALIVVIFVCVCKGNIRKENGDPETEVLAGDS